jgi:hypothetical protein
MKETLSANVGASKKIETTINVGASQTLEASINAGGGSGISKEYDPTVPQHVKNITKEDIEKWNNNTVEEVEDTGWIDLEPLHGTWYYLQYRVIGKQVIIRGHTPDYAWNTEDKVMAIVPENIIPAVNAYAFSVVGGTRISRVGINQAGHLFCDYVINTSDGSYHNKAVWQQFNFSYYLD